MDASGTNRAPPEGVGTGQPPSLPPVDWPPLDTRVPPPAEWSTPPPAVGEQPGWSPSPVPRGPAPGLAYAGFWMRFFACLVDVVVLIVLYIVLLFVIGFAAGGVIPRTTSEITLMGWVVILLSTAFSFVYFAITWANWRATPGQRLLNLMVVRQEDGGRLSLGRATVRWAALTLPVVSLFLFFITWLWPIIIAISIAVDARKQGIHDRIANTFVVQYLPGTR